MYYTFNKLKQTGSYLCFYILFLICGACTSVFAQNVSIAGRSDPLEKVDPIVIERAKQGVTQTVLVVLDVSDISTRQADQRKAMASQLQSITSPEALSAEQQLVEQTKKEYDDIKIELLPGGKLGRILLREDFSHSPMVAVDIPDYAALLELAARPRVKTINAVRQAVPAGSSNLQLIEQPSAIQAGKGGANTRIAILDDGLYKPQAPEFSWSGSGLGCGLISGTGGKSGDLPGSGDCRMAHAIEWDNQGRLVQLCSYSTCISSMSYHGQNSASIAATVAPKAALDIIRVISYLVQGDSYKQDMSRAFDWILGNYASAPRIVAVNLSFVIQSPSGDGSIPLYSTPCSNDAYASQISQMIAAGIVVVAASGNSGSLTSVASPACIPGVVAVGAVTDSSTSATSYPKCSDPAISTADKVPCFSNGGPLVKIYAPGVGIKDSQGDVLTGTSQAAPHVAGAVAIVRGSGAYPQDTASQTVSRLAGTGKPILDTRTSSNLTYPRINLSAATGLTIWSVVISPDNASASVGDTLALTATAKNYNGDTIPNPSSTQWSSSNQNVATVNSSGTLSAVGVGTTTITAILGGIGRTSTITVSSKPSTNPPNCKSNPKACS